MTPQTRSRPGRSALPRLVTIALVICCGVSSSLHASQRVSFRTDDGVTLAATWYEPAGRTGPAVILVHMLHRTRRDFDGLASRLVHKQRRERQQKEAAHRKSLIGSGDRSERIRTYNFPQGRVTDHRINLTLYKIDAIMQGDLDELIGALAQEFQAEQLATLADGG